ncbi:unnamed protein product [Prunus armeniaca]
MKLRHYVLPFTIYIIAKTYLIKYMLTRPMLRGRIGKGTLALTEFAFRAHTCLNNPIYSVHLTPWKLYFDGSKTDVASRARIVLEEPLGIRHCYSFQLDFQCTNNMAEYEALIIGLEMLGLPFGPGAYRFVKHFAFLRTKEKLQRQNPLGLAIAVLKAEAEGRKRHGLKKLWLNHHVASGPHAPFNEVMPLTSQQNPLATRGIQCTREVTEVRIW